MSALEEAEELRQELKHLQLAREKAEARLRSIEKRCHGHFYNPLPPRLEITPPYTIPEFRQGSDFSPALNVPEERTLYHQRRCVRCGRVEETHRVRHTTTTAEPDWRYASVPKSDQTP